jgi:hypothetical protein
MSIRKVQRTITNRSFSIEEEEGEKEEREGNKKNEKQKTIRDDGTRAKSK